MPVSLAGAPTASVVVPTRQRRDYLEVALRSVADQVRAHGAELLVVEDDPEDSQTRALAESFGARYLAHGEVRGLNAARNTAVAAARADLLCFLDDDVDVWDGWLAALLKAESACPEHAVFGGPIRARLEGSRVRLCGREPAPVTALDLGRADRDAEFAWGANLTLRRAALERVGGFDEGLDLYGDEEELQRRLHALGERVRYVANAGVDHRRAGPDAQLPGLARAAYFRGRNSRRYDGRKGTQPALARELRTLVGCAVHAVRFACGNGLVMTAHTAGRVRETLAPAASDGIVAAPAAPTGSNSPDFLSGESGTLSRRTHAIGTLRDLAADARALPQRVRVARAARRTPPRRRVLVVSVARPDRAQTTRRLVAELERSRHTVSIELVTPAPQAGKWENLNRALAARPADGFDWLLVADDDVAVPRGFLNTFLAVAEAFDLRLAQPAHAFASHAAWAVTRRHPGSLARRTSFVEIGPITALRASTFATLLPFPDLQMGWGLDVHWGAIARERGWPIGIVDCTPIRHLAPVAAAYPRDAAIAEAHAFLAQRPYVRRDEAQRTLQTHRAWP